MYKQICPKIIPLVFKVSGVYCISLGEHFYIGSSKNIQQRISQHRKKLRANKHQSKFQMYYNILNAFYVISIKNTIVYNKKINKIYKNLKEASEDTKISTRYLKKACITEHTEWFYMNQCARVKLSESGKLFTDKTTLIQASQKCDEGSTTR